MRDQGPTRDGWSDHGGPPPGGGWQPSGAPPGGQAQQPARTPGAPPGRVRRRASAHRGANAGVPARPLALLLGVLATLGLLGATLGFAVDLFVAPSRLLTADLEESLHLLASLVGIGGAFELYRGTRQGRSLVLGSLGLNLLATLVFSSSSLAQVETLVPVLTWLTLGVLTALADQPNQPAG